MDRQYLGTLFQYYGSLLNEKQANAIDLYYFEDLSLTEIAEVTKTSKQAVSNLLKRSEDLLLDYEEKLSLYKNSSNFRSEIIKLIDEINNEDSDKKNIVQSLNKLLEKI